MRQRQDASWFKVNLGYTMSTMRPYLKNANQPPKAKHKEIEAQAGEMAQPLKVKFTTNNAGNKRPAC